MKGKENLKGDYEMPIYPSEATQDCLQGCMMCLVGCSVLVRNITGFDVFASVKSALYLLS